jgi:hypothetical protein
MENDPPAPRQDALCSERLQIRKSAISGQPSAISNQQLTINNWQLTTDN